jgi:AcrR family transcriptional regulator
MRAANTSNWSGNWAATFEGMARRNTRELILETSLRLFNALGEPNVTTNHIADEADISPGNLYYHYRSKDDIVLELFKRFLVRFQPLLDIPDDTPLQAEDLWFQLHLSFELKGEFRFLYRNLPDLAARIPNFDRAMRATLARERRSVQNFLSGLRQSGAITASEDQQELLTDTVLLSLTYWIPFAELFETGGIDDSAVQVRAIARVMLAITPWLREPERTEFRRLAQGYLSHST